MFLPLTLITALGGTVWTAETCDISTRLPNGLLMVLTLITFKQSLAHLPVRAPLKPYPHGRTRCSRLARRASLFFCLGALLNGGGNPKPKRPGALCVCPSVRPPASLLHDVPG